MNQILLCCIVHSWWDLLFERRYYLSSLYDTYLNLSLLLLCHRIVHIACQIESYSEIKGKYNQPLSLLRDSYQLSRNETSEDKSWRSPVPGDRKLRRAPFSSEKSRKHSERDGEWCDDVCWLEAGSVGRPIQSFFSCWSACGCGWEMRSEKLVITTTITNAISSNYSSHEGMMNQSKPIPIPLCKGGRNSSDSDDEANHEAKMYEAATWRMFDLICRSRQIRAAYLMDRYPQAYLMNLMHYHIILNNENCIMPQPPLASAQQLTEDMHPDQLQPPPKEPRTVPCCPSQFVEEIFIMDEL